VLLFFNQYVTSATAVTRSQKPGSILMNLDLERRTDVRELFSITVQFDCAQNDDPGCKSGNAVTSNLSQKGMGLFTSQNVELGKEIIIRSHKLDEQPVRAEVKWVYKYANALYKLGVCFN
jgi:hypothetical protein